MSECKSGDWIEISSTILTPDQRAPGLPEDTAGKPYTLRVRGIALGRASFGDDVSLRTPSGRTLTGRLEAVNPAFRHDFGECVPELVATRLNIKKAASGETL